jgi:glycosyltransferase involved in cell wall biosynthesis
VFDVIVAVGQTVKEGYLSKIPTNKAIKILYNTNETERILELAKENVDNFENMGEEVKICSVGKLIPVKSFDRLIRVHKRLLDAGYDHNVYLIGKGSEKENLQKLVATLKLQDSVHLIGFRENPYAYVSKSDLYVCSSIREGFSTAVTEALVLGVPVVTTECSGMKELLGENNEYGIVTENSEDGLYEGLKAMLSNPELRASYKEKAKERGKRFGREQTVQAVEEMLLTL